jgi:hypothetical protein
MRSHPVHPLSRVAQAYPATTAPLRPDSVGHAGLAPRPSSAQPLPAPVGPVVHGAGAARSPHDGLLSTRGPHHSRRVIDAP